MFCFVCWFYREPIKTTICPCVCVQYAAPLWIFLFFNRLLPPVRTQKNSECSLTVVLFVCLFVVFPCRSSSLWWKPYHSGLWKVMCFARFSVSASPSSSLLLLFIYYYYLLLFYFFIFLSFLPWRHFVRIGSIDEVEKVVHLTWVQPRVLDLNQVCKAWVLASVWLDSQTRVQTWTPIIKVGSHVWRKAKHKHKFKHKHKHKKKYAWTGRRKHRRACACVAPVHTSFFLRLCLCLRRKYML